MLGFISGYWQVTFLISVQAAVSHPSILHTCQMPAVNILALMKSYDQPRQHIKKQKHYFDD